jgi:hypothetical protein
LKRITNTNFWPNLPLTMRMVDSCNPEPSVGPQLIYL